MVTDEIFLMEDEHLKHEFFRKKSTSEQFCVV